MTYIRNNDIDGEYDHHFSEPKKLEEITPEEKRHIIKICDKHHIPYDKYFPVGFLES